MTCNTLGSLPTALRRIVGARDVLDDPTMLAQYEQDWTGRFQGRAGLVVRPANTHEVAQVVRECAAAGVAIVPQGGNTGLVGGGVPRDGEVVLSLTRLCDIDPVDPGAGFVELGAGVTLRALQEHAHRSGFDAGIDFAARDTATIGGLVACDAGGLRAMRYGTARARVAGLEVVLADGSVLELHPPVLKDNAGYPLPSLMIGAEGTLGIITRVRWRLVALLPSRITALVPLPSIDAAVELLSTVRPLLPSLDAVEFMLETGMRSVLRYLDVPAPIPPSPVYVLLEAAAREDPADEFFAALEHAGVEDAIIAADATDRARLWRFRESHSEAVAMLGTPKKFDIGVPLDRLAAFTERLPDMVRELDADATTILFGHLADGNVHVNVLPDGADDARLGELIYGFAVQCGGTISAEHGIGIEKGRWLHLLCSPAELAAMLQVKRALDPDDVLNPGVGLPRRELTDVGDSLGGVR